MALADRWLLPDGVKDILPPDAERVEGYRRRLLDLYASWGYGLVMPPLMEHLDSLLTGVGQDLDLNTFKLTDQLSGRTLGVRADITPQVARIDAHRMHHQGVNRLCYCSPVLHTRPTHPLASRNPLQIGAEVYGHSGIESDFEIISLMIATCREIGADQELSLDLGHVGVFRALMSSCQLSSVQQRTYQDILQRKALPELAQFVKEQGFSSAVSEWLLALPKLNGDVSVLDEAVGLLPSDELVSTALTYLKGLSDRLLQRFPSLDLYFDLSELRGYNYHTGVVFALYSPLYGQAIAKGGRYDNIGSDFGVARAATGFSADLKTLVQLAVDEYKAPQVVLAPLGDDAGLLLAVEGLRASGVRVVQQLSVDETWSPEVPKLVLKQGEWLVQFSND